MNFSVLVIDDDEKISALLDEILTRAGYECLHAYSGTEALMVLEKKRPDLVLLDLMLPGLSGEKVLPKIEGIPVIVLSAKAGVDDKVNLLLGGAADYITKPFDTKELLARIEVQLRNKSNIGATGIYRCGDLTLDNISHEVTISGEPLKLTKTEYAILKLLIKRPDKVTAKSAILEMISEDTPDCTESSLKTHISHLRSKLREAGGKEYIESIWGIGFKMKKQENE